MFAQDDKKANNVSNNRVANLSNQTSGTKESKPKHFDNVLTNLLSSAAVDQAAEEMYRRAQDQERAVTELTQARNPNLGPSQSYDNRPTNGNGVHPGHPQPLND